LQSRNEFDQFHHGHRVEEMEPRPTLVERERGLTAQRNVRTTGAALLLPNADVADSHCGTAEAAILEMDIVLVARIASGLVSAA